MNEQRVRRLIECYGGRPAAWPAEERAAAQAVLARSPALQAEAAEAAALDAAVHALAAPAPHGDLAALRGRIVGALPASPRPAARRAHPPRAGGWMLFTGAALAASLVVAVALNLRPSAEGPAADAAAVAFDAWAREEALGAAPAAAADPVDSGLLAMGFAPEELASNDRALP